MQENESFLLEKILIICGFSGSMDLRSLNSKSILGGEKNTKQVI